MTIRLYHDSPLLAFDAVAVSHVDGDATRVVLDRTAFYPTSGGQPHDTGILGGARVVDVINDDADEIIVHVCDAQVPLGPVHGQVDAARRHDFTQQHTAQHLLSAVAADRLGWSTESVHFGVEHSHVEFAVDTAPPEALQALEQWANAVVGEARPVTVSREEAEHAKGLRKPPARGGIIRVITIDGIDRSACGGTHTATTAQIGPILLRGVERMRGRIRVGFLAGDRALAHAGWQHQLVTEVARTLRCSPEELSEQISQRMMGWQAASDEVVQLSGRLARQTLAILVGATPPDSAGVRWIEHLIAADDAAQLRLLAQAAAEQPGVVFIGRVEGDAIIAVGAHGDTGVNAGVRLKAALAEAGGRGGGSPRFAQGTVTSPADLDRVVAVLMRR